MKKYEHVEKIKIMTACGPSRPQFNYPNQLCQKMLFCNTPWLWRLHRTAASAQRRPFSTSQRLGQGEWRWPTCNCSWDKLKDVLISCAITKNNFGFNAGGSSRVQSLLPTKTLWYPWWCTVWSTVCTCSYFETWLSTIVCLSSLVFRLKKAVASTHEIRGIMRLRQGTVMPILSCSSVCICWCVLVKNGLGLNFGWIERDKARNDVGWCLDWVWIVIDVGMIFQNVWGLVLT